MEQVYAPWRIEWVERDDPNADVEECVFCELPAAEADRDNRIVARAEDAYLLLNNYPYNPGHAMVVPTEHTGDYAALGESTLLSSQRLLQVTIRAMEAAFDPDGFNVGYNLGGSAAGGSIGDHLHAHVVPRWTGDTNFMPVIGDTKVIVEAVDETYERLRDAVAERPETTVDGPHAAVRLE